ncbi:hypothetical protein PILCRDRAFT_1950 [Piloderma croceum F 1598]|uniref:Uncharacterized protein n=1 Tax=Piloderma croceum (strain F 1598) TaxID=765440 RepID=A0A0C3BSY0_PILCF|nr:hypothetical protein PILCRDRAFT_1950 [Piloderma croceum F 1598]
MSTGDINSLLNIWASTLALHNDDTPFHNHTDLYNTIDSTPIGGVPWESFTMKYDSNIPDGERSAWMDEEFEVWFCNPRDLVHNMLANPDFHGEFDYLPFHEYDANNNHHFHDFMSGNWAWKQADIITQDPDTHGSMFMLIILGSDKTTVSVATGHNQYWPVYMSIGNIHNNTRCAH